jgi:hypothetical protein
MACGCQKNKKTRRYEIEGDPEGQKYITERDAELSKQARGLEGKVVPVLV